MNDCADNLMLTGVLLPCPDCGGHRIFVAPDPCSDELRGVDVACTDCGAALLLDPCLSPDVDAAEPAPELARAG